MNIGDDASPYGGVDSESASFITISVPQVTPVPFKAPNNTLGFRDLVVEACFFHRIGKRKELKIF